MSADEHEYSQSYVIGWHNVDKSFRTFVCFYECNQKWHFDWMRHAAERTNQCSSNICEWTKTNHTFCCWYGRRTCIFLRSTEPTGQSIRVKNSNKFSKKIKWFWPECHRHMINTWNIKLNASKIPLNGSTAIFSAFIDIKMIADKNLYWDNGTIIIIRMASPFQCTQNGPSDSFILFGTFL